MRLLLVAAGVAAAVQHAAAALCTNTGGSQTALGYPAVKGTSNLNSDNSGVNFHVDFVQERCLMGWSGHPEGKICPGGNDAITFDGCSNPGIAAELTKVGSIAKKCKNDKKVFDTTKPATPAACWSACQGKMANDAGMPKQGSMAIAFEKNKICDCYAGEQTYGKTCASCEGGEAYGAGVEYYIPKEAGHYTLPKSCAPASTDDDKDESAASLPLAGATVVAAGVASLYA